MSANQLLTARRDEGVPTREVDPTQETRTVRKTEAQPYAWAPSLKSMVKERSNRSKAERMGRNPEA